ncbi:MAG: hypothetical protein ABII18_04735 [bacterium]|nr:hypothetical protein [bacterium]MBU1917919.1 hypothetical protein [bacterium]
MGRETRQLLYAFFLLIIIAGVFTSCRGGTCAALGNSVADQDSDCVDDTSDVCVGIYDPAQFDGDEDGVGAACDSDDTDETKILEKYYPANDVLQEYFPASEVETGVLSAYSAPTSAPLVTHNLDLASDKGFYYLLSCDENFLGILNLIEPEALAISNPDNDFGNPGSDVSLFNEYGAYGRVSTSCSAFNNEANHPPMILFHSYETNADLFVGYITTSPILTNGYDTCSLMDALELYPAQCDN